MKRTNLTRKEAYKAMIDGHKIGYAYYDKRSYYFFKGGKFKYMHPDGRINLVGEDEFEMDDSDGYFIYEPEPTFKEVTMYAPVVKHKILVGYLYKDKDEAMKEMNAIGYTEVKVFLKSEGDNG